MRETASVARPTEKAARKKKDQLEGLTGQSEERRGEGNKIASEELIKDGKRGAVREKKKTKGERARRKNRTM